MIAGVRGAIAALEPDAVVVDLHGMLVRVLTSARTLAGIGAVGDVVLLHTWLAVREDALTLYGFPERGELELFQLLLGVNGVGPRVALSVLSQSGADDVIRAIDANDLAFLTRAPGIGRKTAEAIVFHIRRKLPDLAPMLASSAPGGSEDFDARQALESLGYSAIEAHAALAAVEAHAGMTVEERVFAALQRLSQG